MYEIIGGNNSVNVLSLGMVNAALRRNFKVVMHSNQFCKKVIFRYTNKY